MRDVAEFLQERMQASPGSASALGYGLGGDIMRIYEPRVSFVRSRQESNVRAKSLRRSNHELYLFYGYEGFNRATVPDGFPDR